MELIELQEEGPEILDLFQNIELRTLQWIRHQFVGIIGFGRKQNWKNK